MKQWNDSSTRSFCSVLGISGACMVHVLLMSPKSFRMHCVMLMHILCTSYAHLMHIYNLLSAACDAEGSPAFDIARRPLEFFAFSEPSDHGHHSWQIKMGMPNRVSVDSTCCASGPSFLCFNSFQVAMFEASILALRSLCDRQKKADGRPWPNI